MDHTRLRVGKSESEQLDFTTADDYVFMYEGGQRMLRLKTGLVILPCPDCGGKHLADGFDYLCLPSKHSYMRYLQRRYPDEPWPGFYDEMRNTLVGYLNWDHGEGWTDREYVKQKFDLLRDSHAGRLYFAQPFNGEGYLESDAQPFADPYEEYLFDLTQRQKRELETYQI